MWVREPWAEGPRGSAERMREANAAGSQLKELCMELPRHMLLTARNRGCVTEDGGSTMWTVDVGGGGWQCACAALMAQCSDDLRRVASSIF